MLVKDTRKIALSLPGAAEADHWGNPSFRVYGRIFATVPDAGHLNVMLDPFEVDGAVRENAGVCSELWWGKQLSGVKVDLKLASRELVGDLLEAAWRRRASKRQLAAAGQAERGRRNRDRKVTASR